MPDLNSLSWWTRLPYLVSPNLIEFNGFAIRYYSLMYVLAFVTVYALIRYRLKTEKFTVTVENLDTFFIWAACGVILGGRLGYVLFYNLSYYLHHPLQVFLPFNFENGFSFTGISGMSYHGGLVGVILAGLLFCRKHRIHFFQFTDLICPAVPLGYTFGRIGNFLNSELYGRITEVPWAMVFPSDPTHALRHPSQLYEAFFEGIFIFGILWTIRKSRSFSQMMLGLYLITYGLVRFVIEFYRLPDAHINFVIDRFSMGQLLCGLMIAAGGLLIAWPKLRSNIIDK